MIFAPEKAFFVIDSDNLESVQSQLYGYTFSDGKVIESASELSLGESPSDGSFVYIKREGQSIEVRQDFMGSYGMCLYRNGSKFALSNSFEYLLEHLSKSGEELTINEDYADHLVVCDVCSSSYRETLINEIEVVPRNEWLEIDIQSRSLRNHVIDYEEGTIDIDSPEALDILDRWYDKWTSSIRSLVEAGEKVTVDLSGGFDSRLTFLLFLGAGIDLNKVKIHSLDDGLHTHKEDWEIANDMADYYNFKLNVPDQHFGKFKTSILDRYSHLDRSTISYYLKNGFHKQMHYPGTLLLQRWNTFSGNGGENLRDYWDMPMQDLYEKKLFQCDKYPLSLSKKYKKGLTRVLDRSFDEIRRKHIALGRPISEEELPRQLFKETYSRYHFGKAQMENYYGSRVYWSPLLDKDPYRLNLKPGNWHDTLILFAVIFDRYQPDLLDFRFEGGRSFNGETLAFARSINQIRPYMKSKITSTGLIDISETRQKRKNVAQLINMNKSFIDGNFYRDKVMESYERRQKEESEGSFDRKATDSKIAEIAFSKSFVAFLSSEYGPDEYIRMKDQMDRATYFPNSVFNTYIANMLARESAKNEGPIPTIPEFLELGWHDDKIDLQPNLLRDPIIAAYGTGRIDVRSYAATNDAPALRMVRVDSGFMHSAKPNWMVMGKNKGYQFDGYAGEADITMECVQDGELEVALRGPDVRDSEGKAHAYVVDFISFSINGESVLRKRTSVTHSKPFKYTMSVTKGDIIDIKAKWVPHEGSIVKPPINKKADTKTSNPSRSDSTKKSEGGIKKGEAPKKTKGKKSKVKKKVKKILK